MREEMTSPTVVRAISARDDLRAIVTAVLPIVTETDALDSDVLQSRYGELLAALGLDAESERDLALLTGAWEVAKWVAISAEAHGVDPVMWWSRYISRVCVS